MNARCVLATLTLSLLAASASAEKPTPSLPAVTAQGVLYVANCEERVLPSQQAVGEWTGQHNFSQVYATRERLMMEIGRACQGAGIEQVKIVSQAHANTMQLVALVDPAR